MIDYVNFVKVTKASLMDFIQNSKERIIIAKPGYFENEINEIINQYKTKDIKVRLYIEEGDQAVRLGFGDEKALNCIKDNFELLNVQTANHIRLSVVIVDDRILVFVPSALAWEDEPKDISFPNGLLGNYILVNKILDQLQISEKQLTINNDLIEQVGLFSNNGLNANIMSFEKFKVQKEKKEIVKEKISKSAEALKDNPSADPTRLKKTTFYRNNYKLIHITVKGKIDNKKIDLSQFNRLIESTNERLRSSWRLFTSEELKNIGEYKEYLTQIEQIKNKYTLDAKKFGLFIDVKNIPILMEELKREKENFINKVTEKDSKSSNLSNIINNSKKALIEYMIKVDKEDIVLKSNRFIESMYEAKGDEARNQAMNMFIMNKLKFPLTEDIIDNIDIDSYIVDVSDELIHENEEFKKLLEMYKTPDENGLKIRSYSDGYENK